MDRSSTFVQIGATRDGLDPYLLPARQRGMKALLIESPAYANFRRLLGRQDFDQTLEVSNPSDTESVSHVLGENAVTPTLVLAGFERYTETAFNISRRMGCFASVGKEPEFRPLNKASQRTIISQVAPSIRQPWFVTMNLRQVHPLDNLGSHLPLVIKPVNSAGGWGVFVARNLTDIRAALDCLKQMPNYDGSKFENVVFEELLTGPEASVQGICCAGEMRILTYSEKIIASRKSAVSSLEGFSELAHIAIDGRETPVEVVRFASICLNALRYKDGPFHLDLINTSKGPAYLEIGFRLSGGALAKVVSRVTGVDWGEAVFAWLLERRCTSASSPIKEGAFGQFVVRSKRELDAARALKSHDVEIQMCNSTTLVGNLDSNLYPELTADLSRHFGRLAYVRIAGRSVRELRKLADQIFCPS